MFAPNELDCKKKVFEETFESPAHFNSESQALYALNEIRDCHPASSGWVEFAGYVRCIDGKWQAVREHAKYE